MSKFARGDTVRVIDPAHHRFDQVGVIRTLEQGSLEIYRIEFGIVTSYCLASQLTLAPNEGEFR